MVICPGGGYGGLAMDHEGKQIGAWLNEQGITGVIVKYRLGSKYNHPVPLGDAQRAIRLVRSKAAELKIDPNRVGILGFSAGGHLASTAGTHFDAGIKDAKDPIDQLSCRPDFVVLLYPVITLTGPFAHVGSRNNLLGKNPDDKLVESFVQREAGDEGDAADLSRPHQSARHGWSAPRIACCSILAAHRRTTCQAELHLYEKGQHGLGLAAKGDQKNLTFASWPDRCIAWMKGRGLLEAK